MKINGNFTVCPWIVVTGLDGSGKTTLVDNLETLFLENNLRVKRTRSPHDQYLTQTLLNVSGSGSPDADSYTDRTIFMLDNRLLGTRINQWRESGDYDLIISQRGFLDAFVHGRVKDYSYHLTADFNRIWELPHCQVMIHLVANAETAYQRIKDDPDADKFETLEYMQVQERETRRAYEALMRKDPVLNHFWDSWNIYVDTTELSTNETFEFVIKKLGRIMELWKKPLGFAKGFFLFIHIKIIIIMSFSKVHFCWAIFTKSCIVFIFLFWNWFTTSLTWILWFLIIYY